MALSS